MKKTAILIIAMIAAFTSPAFARGHAGGNHGHHKGLTTHLALPHVSAW